MAGKARPARPFIFVLAGVNGAGKSSVGGALLAEHGLTWFNPDAFARGLIAELGLAQIEANGRAWAMVGRCSNGRLPSAATSHSRPRSAPKPSPR